MKYLAHLGSDRKLRPVIDVHGPVTLRRSSNVCYMLCASIISQQLGTSVATVIKARFLDLFDGTPPSPEAVLRKRPATLRKIGLSNAKVDYIRNVARFATESGLEHRKLGKMENPEAIEYLTQIKGVGRWTAEMVLMFALGREDVFSAGDGGIRAAMCSLYHLDAEDRKLDEKMNRIAERWQPYRTYACMYLWKYKDQ